MKKVILVTGGARSGKSSFAENVADSFGDKVLYIATSIPFDDEMKDRVRKHRLSRPESWNTYEGYENLGEVVKEKAKNYSGILLDCITLMISNLMFKYIGDKIDNASSKVIDDAEEKIFKNFKELLESAVTKDISLILVTNELGCGIVPENKLARVYRDIVGRINQYVALKADEVYFVTCGIPTKIK